MFSKQDKRDVSAQQEQTVLWQQTMQPATPQ